MEAMQSLDENEMDHDESHIGQCEPSSVNMNLLSVPGSSSPKPAVGSTSRDAKFLRRYSCNPHGKGTHTHPESSGGGGGSGGSGGSPMPRRSSLAAWSVLARRISMGLAHDREPPEDPSKAIAEVNTLVAILRDCLIHIGQSKDGPELREKVRRVRRQSLEACKHAVQIILNQIHNDIAEEIPLDYRPQLVLLFFCTQLLLKELRKSKRLVIRFPMDMSSHYSESRPGPTNFAGVLSQIILCRQINPDFNEEEIVSLTKDTNEIASLLDEMQEFMPKETSQQVAVPGFSYEEVFTRSARRRRRLGPWCDFDSLCCISKSRRLSGY